ncbi:MAG: TonB-dependent receptor [Microscillaceae bacterium]|nr:TonB-dependent receptor [Microscillaceae bacterium]
MKKLVFILFLTCIAGPMQAMAQSEISGKIADKAGKPIAFANVYLKDIYEGTTTDEEGYFSFVTQAQGEVMLLVSFTGYKVLEIKLQLQNEPVRLELVMEEAPQELAPVVITAGAFEASDQKKMTILKPLDIVTVAGAAADVYGALRTLPGVSQIGNENGLFVRGGQAYETQTVINGMLVPHPFFSSVPDLPSRGRFDPFMFQGTLFSTGGYSAEYGQALSSVLILHTQDIPENTSTGIGLNAAELDINHVQKFNKNTTLIAGGGYSNLSPWFSLIPQNTDWQTAPQGYGGSLGWLQSSNSGNLWKTYIRFQAGEVGIYSPDLDRPGEDFLFRNENQNLFINSSYRGMLGENWDIYGGFSYTSDLEDIFPGEDQIQEKESLWQSKLTLGRDLSEKVYLHFGGEMHHLDGSYSFNQYNQRIDENYGAAFAEVDIRFSRKLAARAGIRGEYSGILDQGSAAPRLSLAYKTGANSQVSFAYGWFYQRPENQFLRQTQDISFEQSSHYILNYQWLTEKHTFRAEIYYKDYENLVKNTSLEENPFQNEGYGYAAGIDIFWRDQKSVKNLDYWLSYSFILSERNYRDYPLSATPTFLTPHTLSLVGRYTLPELRLRLGATYTFASGRTYLNPNNPEFLADRTPAYHNLSLNVSYLTTLFGQFTVLFASVTNPLGWEQIYGYRYSEDGQRRMALLPGATTSAFVGIYISIE